MQTNTTQYILLYLAIYGTMLHQYKPIHTNTSLYIPSHDAYIPIQVNTNHCPQEKQLLDGIVQAAKEEDQALVSVEDLSKVRPLDPFWDVGIDGLLGQRAGLAV